MSKKLTSKQKKEQLNQLFAAYNRRLGMLYSSYIKKLASLDYGDDTLENDALFNFDNFPTLRKRLDDIFNDYYTNNMLCYENGITDGVSLAYSHDNADLSGFSVMSDKALSAARKTAAETFIASRLHTDKGLNLAQRIWNYCQQTKSEFEVAMSNVIADGLNKGTSAEDIGRRIRQYLKEPDMMYRRYHTVQRLANGQKKDVVTWRRKRIIDGRIRFVEEPLEKVGQGVYRSSRMNALRVARTEINAAYHTARNDRWANEPFVIGQHIHVSPQHDPEKCADICDDLEGYYPKGFVWNGWHPQCMCTSDPVMISGEEREQFYKRLYNGEDMSNYVSPNRVKDVPNQYKRYIEDNADKIVDAYKRDKLAWHLANNKSYWIKFLDATQRKEMGADAMSRRNTIQEIAKTRHAKRDAQALQRNWTLRRSYLYLERMNNALDGIQLKGALQERYNAVLSALKSSKTWDIANVESLYKKFAQGININNAYIVRTTKAAFNVYYKEHKNGIKQSVALSNLCKRLKKATDAKEVAELYAKLRHKSLVYTRYQLRQTGLVRGLTFDSDINAYEVSKARTVITPKGKSVDIRGYVSDFVKYTDKNGMSYYYEVFTDALEANMDAGRTSKFLETCPSFIIENLKGIMSCNKPHPLDDYFKKVYKGFKKGYMYSSEPVTVHTRSTWEYFKESICHETGHHIDKRLQNVSSMTKWLQAQKSDGNFYRPYSRQAPTEDFADTVAQYIKDKEKCRKQYPHRTALLETLLATL
nr:MAG TPA: minor capsid protein [Caudoviricetes sp.]